MASRSVDLSCLPEKDLRPWAVPPGTEEMLQEVEDELRHTMNLTSYSRNAGTEGCSVLDKKPKEFLMLEKILKEELDKIGEVSPESDGGETVSIVITRENKEISPTDDVDEDEVQDEVAALPVAEKSKSELRSVVYTQRPGPAILNVSVRKYKELMKAIKEYGKIVPDEEAATQVPCKQEEVWKKTMNVLPKHYAGKSLSLPNANADTLKLITSKEIFTIHTKGQFQPAVEEKQDVVKNKIARKDELFRTDVVMFPRLREEAPSLSSLLSARTTVEAQILNTSRSEAGIAAPGGVAGSSSATKPGDKILISSARKEEKPVEPPNTSRFFITLLDDVVDEEANKPSDKDKSSVSNANIDSGKDKSLPQLTIPKKVLDGPASSPRKVKQVTSPRSGELTARSQKSNGPNSARKKIAVKPSPRDSLSSKALQKLLISTDTSVQAESFTRKRVSEVRSLKDQMVTATGLQMLNARLIMSDTGIQNEFKDDHDFTQKMIASTKLRNKMDQTWPILSTPGFNDAVGTDNIYISDTHRLFTPPKVLSPVKIRVKVRPNMVA